MKYILIVILALIAFASCGDNITENTMVVSGNVKGLKKGTLYLQHVPDSTLVVIDSLQVDGDGNFSFHTELESPDIFYLYLNKKDNNDINDRIVFFGEPGTITIKTAWNTFDANAEIEGSDSHLKLEEFKKIMTQFNVKNLEYANASITSETPLDSIQLDSIQRLNNKNIKRGYAFALNFALSNADSPIAPYIAVNEVSDANFIYLDSIYSILSPEVAASKYGKRLKKHLESLNRE